MIPVIEVKEPSTFDALVRTRGVTFLAGTPKPTDAEWRKNSYWTRALADLRSAYGQLCAYSATWIPYTDGQSVDHFVAKSVDPALAYEWSNFRYVFGYLNGCKGTADVLDPFKIERGWFAIQFPSLLVVPGDGLDAALSKKVRDTAKRLHLNDEDRCLGDRRDYLRNYCEGRVTFEFLVRKTPFLAQELERQGLVEGIRAMMRFS